MTQLDLFPPKQEDGAFPTPAHLLAIIRNDDGRYSKAEMIRAQCEDIRLATDAWYAARGVPARQAA